MRIEAIDPHETHHERSESDARVPEIQIPPGRVVHRIALVPDHADAVRVILINVSGTVRPQHARDRRTGQRIDAIAETRLSSAGQDTVQRKMSRISLVTGGDEA